MKKLIFISSLFAIVLTGTIHTMEQTLTYDTSLCSQGFEALVLRNLNIFTQPNQDETLAQTNTTTRNVQTYSLPIGTPKPQPKQVETQTPALTQEVITVTAEQTNQLPQIHVTTPNMQTYPILTNTTQLQIQKLTKQAIQVTNAINNLNGQISYEIYALEFNALLLKPCYPMEQVITFFPNEKASLAQKMETRNQLLKLLDQLKLEIKMFQSHQ